MIDFTVCFSRTRCVLPNVDSALLVVGEHSRAAISQNKSPNSATNYKIINCLFKL